MLGWLRSWIPSRKKVKVAAGVRSDEAGLVVEQAAAAGVIDQRTIQWSDITRVVIYKRDVYIGDFICMAIETRAGLLIEVNEDFRGWKEFSEGLHTHLTGAMLWEEWVLKIIAAPCGEMVTIYDASLGGR